MVVFKLNIFFLCLTHFNLLIIFRTLAVNHLSFRHRFGNAPVTKENEKKFKNNIIFHQWLMKQVNKSHNNVSIVGTLRARIHIIFVVGDVARSNVGHWEFELDCLTPQDQYPGFCTQHECYPKPPPVHCNTYLH